MANGKKNNKAGQTSLFPPGFTSRAEKVLFVAWGKENKKENSYVVEKGDVLVAVVLDVKESSKFTYKDKDEKEKQTPIFHLKIKGVPETVVLIPPTHLRNQLLQDPPVKINDEIAVYYKSETKTGRGKPMKVFELAVK